MQKIGGVSGKSFITVNVELLGGLGVAIAPSPNLLDESKRNKVILESAILFFLDSLKNLAKSYPSKSF